MGEEAGEDAFGEASAAHHDIVFLVHRLYQMIFISTESIEPLFHSTAPPNSDHAHALKSLIGLLSLNYAPRQAQDNIPHEAPQRLSSQEAQGVPRNHQLQDLRILQKK